MDSLDYRILESFCSLFSSPALDFIMPKISALGNGGLIWIAIAFILLMRKSSRRSGALLLLSLSLGLLIGNVILKPLIARPRPCWVYPHPMLIEIPTDYSFPSGHTLSSFSSSFILLKEKVRGGHFFLFLAFLIALSRAYLFVHYFTDIIGAIVLGTLIGFISEKIFSFVERKIKQGMPLLKH